MDIVSLVQSLTEAGSREIAEAIKERVDRNWHKQPQVALELARLIQTIADLRNDPWIRGLGTMAYADSLKHAESNFMAAWSALDEAGDLFRQAGDDVGWARTRIGRLALCFHVEPTAQDIEEALSDAEAARTIFLEHNEQKYLYRLELNTGVMYDERGDYQRSLRHYEAAHTIAHTNTSHYEYLGALYLNIGYAHYYLGNFSVSQQFYEKALEILEAEKQTQGIKIAALTLAALERARGQYRSALKIHHRIIKDLAPFEAAINSQDMVDCYIALGDYKEAIRCAPRIIEAFRKLGTEYDTAYPYVQLAIAQAEAGALEAAEQALNKAEEIFQKTSSDTWVAFVRLRRGQVALRRGQPDLAHALAVQAEPFFKEKQHKVPQILATLLRAQVALVLETLTEAETCARDALHIAKQDNLPEYSYSAHLLLGKIFEAKLDISTASHHYEAAAAIASHMAHDLTIMLRPKFLENKKEAIHSLIRLYLGSSQLDIPRAFAALEHSKSQILFEYLANQSQFHWLAGNPYIDKLLEELNELRAQHQWLSNLALNHQPASISEANKLDWVAVDTSQITYEQAHTALVDLETRIIAITSELYLQRPASYPPANIQNGAYVSQIQSCLPDNGHMIVYYNDNGRYKAFVIGPHQLSLCDLEAEVGTIKESIELLAQHMSDTLTASPEHYSVALSMTRVQRVLGRLYASLVVPLGEALAPLREGDRLIIVPYGDLHAVPFHLLHNGIDYLICNYEVVIQPSAGLITRPPLVVQSPGVRVVAYEGTEPEKLQTNAEAQMIQAMWGTNDVSIDENAIRDQLFRTPVTILHIAAHGYHHRTHPELSSIELADGALHADDVLQHDMRYELVVLSACETGLGRVGGGEELIGLQRGFLYAGAGALLTSLWHIPDEITLKWMEKFYTLLKNGTSKAEAVRQTQIAMMKTELLQHPAWWGAFQLIGDANPLSSTPFEEIYHV